MKIQTKEKLYNFINCGGMTAIIAAIIIICVVIGGRLLREQEIEFMDWTIFTSIVVAMLLEVFFKIFSRWLLNKLEDARRPVGD